MLVIEILIVHCVLYKCICQCVYCVLQMFLCPILYLLECLGIFQCAEFLDVSTRFLYANENI